MKLLLTAFFILTAGIGAKASDQDFEEALVISRPETLKAIESSGFSLGDLISRSASTGAVDNQELSQMSSFKPILQNLKEEMTAYQKKRPKAGVGLQFDERLFDLRYMENPRARFVLVGVVNRMDTGFRAKNRCGEIRFIYRLAYSVQDHGTPVSSRLPMTINLVMNAGTATDNNACADLGKAWLRVNAETPATELISNGPLSQAYFKRENIKSLEINLQIVRMAASERPDFGGHAEYLLKVYKWNQQTFESSTLENQIDRDNLKANPELLAELKKWLLDPKNVKAIDAGTQIIPEKFLAKSALSIAPGGFTRAANRMFTGLVSEEDAKKISFSELEIIKTPAAFIRRLNDSTCVGCHQTRAIGGFHFTGKDPMGKYPGNSVFLAGSAHFMGDLARRHAVVEEIVNKKEVVDFSRGFSARPQDRRSKQLIGTGLFNGWGAHCATGKDPSFASWTCAEGLVCRSLLKVQDGLGMGVCLGKDQQVGDPCEDGIVKSSGFGVDRYVETSDRIVIKIPNGKCSPQGQAPGTRTGGFLSGNLRTLSCENLPKEASCGPLPAARPGFNACIGQKNFGECLKEYSLGVGLRGCDQKNPCRDDYICSESFETKRGSCVPPYFLFQFRVDGHPRGSN